MKTASVGSPARYVLLALGVLISYLVAEVLTLGVFYAPVLPLSLVLDDVLGLGLGVTLAVLASAMVVSVGVETLIIASLKG